MIEVEGLTFTYPGAPSAAISDVDLRIAEGELVLVVGTSGSGKSTLLRSFNGLVPHFSGGTFAGRVLVAGRDTRPVPPRELADVVGFVFQDPEAQTVAEVVEDEIAFAMENLALPELVLRRRMEEVVDLLAVEHLRHRSLATLSGGERQRVAIAAVLAAQPRVLVLDEPTSQLDPLGAEEVLAALERLVHDLGITVVLAEHRIERVAGHADRVIALAGGRVVGDGAPADVLAGSPLAPPVARLGVLADWTPVPLTVREARRFATGLRARLAPMNAPARPQAPPGPPVAWLEDVRVEYPGSPRRRALDRVRLSVQPGEIVALMGRNGSGKSTLLRTTMGLVRPVAGTVEVAGRPIAGRRTASVARDAGYVAQDPSAGLFAETVRAEIAFTATNHRLPAAAVDEAIAALGLERLADRHPRDLSAGERLLVAVAAVLVAGPRLLLLDEPTRGVDVLAKTKLATLLRAQAAAGVAVILATHDVELAAIVADRVVLLADGSVVADGPAVEVLADSPVFSPQVARVLGLGGWLTVDDVRRGLEATA